MPLTAVDQSKGAAAKALCPGRQEPRSVHGGVGTGVPVTPKTARTSVKGLVKRTRMCKFNFVGACKRGSGCSFAHSEADLQEEPDLWKTTLCTSFSRRKCKKGDTCNFAHGLHELRKRVCEKGLQASDGQHTTSGDLQDPGDRLFVSMAEKLVQDTAVLSLRLLQELQAMEGLRCQPMLQPLVLDSLPTGQLPFPSSRQSTMQPPSDDALPELSYKAFSRQSSMRPPSTGTLPEASYQQVLSLGTIASPEDVDSDTDDESEQSFSDEVPVIITIKNTFIHAAANMPSPRRSKSLPAHLGRS